MIWIRQKLIPTEFAQWKAGNKGINFNYSSLPGEIKKILKQSLLEERKSPIGSIFVTSGKDM